MHTVKAVGRLTRWLQGLRPGDVLFLRGPYGRPWPLEEARGRHLLLLSGGMGLAPLRPVVGLFLSGRLGARRLSLLHGARRPRDIIFKEELSAWQGQGLEVLLTVDVPEEGWPGRVGLVTELLGELELEPHRTVAFICGPEIMMRFVLRELLIKGLSPRRLHVSLERRMRCGLGLCGHCQHGVWFVCRDGPVFSYPQVRGLPDGLL
jgi:NAD(P)H-flavin reductase